MPSHRRLSWRSVKRLLLATDLVSTTIALATAYWLRFHWSSFAGLEPRVPSFPLWTMVLFGATFLVAFSLAGVYRRENVISGLDEYGRILAASAMAVLLVIAVAYLTSFAAVSRGFVLLALGFVTFGVCLGRFGARRVIYRAASLGRYLETAVVVGVNHQAIDVARQLNQNPSTSTRVIGFLSDYRPKGSVVADGLVVLGEPLELDQVARDVGANRAVVVESGLAWESLRGIVQTMHRRGDIAISLVPGLSDIHSTRWDVRQMGTILTLCPRPARITGGEAVLKRTVDIVVSLSGLLLSLPLIAVVASVALRDGRGSGLTKEKFIGPEGFITLRRIANPAWAKRGHLSRIPELSQVLSGQMSLIGPRPVPVGRAGDYAKVVALLESAKPGFIGPWWIVGLSRPRDTKQELAFDLFYVRHYSVWLDVEILVKAVHGLLARRSPPTLGWVADGRLVAGTLRESGNPARKV